MRGGLDYEEQVRIEKINFHDVDVCYTGEDVCKTVVSNRFMKRSFC